MPVPVEPLDLVDLDLVEEKVVDLVEEKVVDLVDLGLVEEKVVDLVDLTAQKGKKGVLVQAQEEAWDLTAGRLLQTLLGEGTMHLQKGE